MNRDAHAPSDPPTVTAPSTQDALEVLAADHRQIDALMSDLLRVGTAQPADVSGLLARVAARMRVHDTIENELFYAALESRLPRDALTAARLAHQRIDAQLQALATEAVVQPQQLHDLQGLWREHMQQEEQTLFAAAAGLDLAALGTQLASRRAELLAGEVGAD